MNSPLLEALMGLSGQLRGDFQRGLANPAPHEPDAGALERADLAFSMSSPGGSPDGYGGGPMGDVGVGASRPNDDINQNGSVVGGMRRSSNPWQPPMWSSGAQPEPEPEQGPIPVISAE